MRFLLFFRIINDMKVKVGDKIYDSEKEPILLILNSDDRMNISLMAPKATRFCSYPRKGPYDNDFIRKFMEID